MSWNEFSVTTIKCNNKQNTTDSTGLQSKMIACASVSGAVSRCLRTPTDRSYRTIGDISYTMTWHWIEERTLHAFLAYRVFGYQNIRRDFWFSLHAYTRTLAVARPCIVGIVYTDNTDSHSRTYRSHFVGGPLCIVCALCKTAEFSPTRPLYTVVPGRAQDQCEKSGCL